jgi:hypothetical protein
MTRKNKTINIVLGAIGVFLSLILLLFFNEIVEFLIIIAEKYLSEDNSVKRVNLWLFQGAAAVLIAFIFLISILFFVDFYSRILRLFASIFDLNKMHTFFIKDDLSNNERLSKVTLIIATASAIILHLYFLIFGEPVHEGYLEEISSLFIFVSGFILILGLRYLKKEYFSPFWHRTLQFTLVFLGLGLFFLFGEEINWGQRALELEPSEFFKTYNFQDEISLHNFLNPLFIFIYPAVGMSSFIILIFLWMFYKGEKNYYLKLFIPHKNLFFLIFCMAGASYNGDSEIYEEMLTVFFLLYSIRILFSLKNSRKNSHSKILKKEYEYMLS